MNLSRVNKAAGTGQLWKAVNKLTRKQRDSESDFPLTVEEMNSFYAVASTDSGYLPIMLKDTASPNVTICHEADIFSILDSLKPTSEGLNRLPACFFRLLAPVCSGWIASLFNHSLNTSTISEQWRVARIRPVAKMKTPEGPGDFRPISVVPVLSMVLERIVVSRYIYPALAEPPINKLIQDQFAFRPTGSTSAALIDLLQTTDLLRVNEYVAIILVDFTKPFDRIRHHPLSQKYLLLHLPH